MSSTTLESFDGGVESRPESCECLKAFHDVPCWSCYRNGFETPNPNAEENNE